MIDEIEPAGECDPDDGTKHGDRKSSDDYIVDGQNSPALGESQQTCIDTKCTIE